ncbi:MAG: hypothetical protein RI893_620 [Pseudomonadota bacterium]|jgi:CheY-like chemotaxis protein
MNTLNPNACHQSDAQTTKKILIVDDHRIIRVLIRLTLGDDNFQITECSNTLEVLKSLKESIPDLIILDIMMPGKIDGYTLCENLKSNDLFKNIKIILLSARGGIDDIEEGTRVKADAYITKPFSPLKLIYEVNSLLAQSEHLFYSLHQQVDLQQ